GRTMPDPSSAPQAYDDAVIARIPEHVTRTQGRAFVLFTSYQTMQRAVEQLREPLAREGLTILSQADGLPRSQLLEKFRTTRGAVLFGVDSFWQGVDVPGDALVTVIITKLPFTAPDRPILEARQGAIQEAGGQPFSEYQVPQAVIKFKQGFGRLIRTCTDRGMVVIFDPRVLTKGYGRTFLQALPPCRRYVDGVAQDEEEEEPPLGAAGFPRVAGPAVPPQWSARAADRTSRSRPSDLSGTPTVPVSSPPARRGHPARLLPARAVAAWAGPALRARRTRNKCHD